jgi:hypothetical protein
MTLRKSVTFCRDSASMRLMVAADSCGRPCSRSKLLLESACRSFRRVIAAANDGALRGLARVLGEPIQFVQQLMQLRFDPCTLGAYVALGRHPGQRRRQDPFHERGREQFLFDDAERRVLGVIEPSSSLFLHIEESLLRKPIEEP